MKSEQVEKILDACRRISTREMSMAELADLLRGIEPENDPFRPESEKKGSHVYGHSTGPDLFTKTKMANRKDHD